MGEGLATLAAAGLLAAWSLLAVRAAREQPRLRSLRDAPPALSHPPPLVSIVVAARDEAPGVTGALRSMALQDYPALEVVAVDDRSTDGTGELLDRLAAELPTLQVLHVSPGDLPPGWLGKNHALARGAAAARGRWLLFTDADVHLAPGALRRAVAYAEAAGLDHLAVTPHLEGRGLLLLGFLAFFTVLFSQLMLPSRVRAGRVAVGVGAFNLVRREAYLRAGGYGAIRHRPDDDVQLGRRLRAVAAARQDLLVSGGLVRIPWYPSAGAAIRGFEKNAYAGSDYRWLRAAGQAAFLFLLCIVPPLWALAGVPAAATGAGSLPGWPLAAAATLLFAGIAAGTATLGGGLPPWAGLLAPAGAAVFLYGFVRAVWLAERAGGVRWRDTFYPLDLLRERSGP